MPEFRTMPEAAAAAEAAGVPHTHVCKDGTGYKLCAPKKKKAKKKATKKRRARKATTKKKATRRRTKKRTTKKAPRKKRAPKKKAKSKRKRGPRGASQTGATPPIASLKELKIALENYDPRLPRQHGQIATDDLPTFGGAEPADTTEIVSWDADSVLMLDNSGAVSIEARGAAEDF